MLGFLKRIEKKKEESKEILCWCPFHDTLVGWIDIKVRRRMIKRTKPEHEIETRLRELVPVDDVYTVMYALCRGMSDFAHSSESQSYWRGELENVHRDEVPSTMWDGVKLVFPKELNPESP